MTYVIQPSDQLLQHLGLLLGKIVVFRWVIPIYVSCEGRGWKQWSSEQSGGHRRSRYNMTQPRGALDIEKAAVAAVKGGLILVRGGLVRINGALAVK